MTYLERLDEALAAGVVATSQHGEAVVVGASVFLHISDAARAYRDLLANPVLLVNPVHDKGRTCERTEEVLEHYRERALSAEKLAIRIGRGKVAEGAEPDYEAAVDLLNAEMRYYGIDFEFGEPQAAAVVDAAIGGRLLVEPEEER